MGVETRKPVVAVVGLDTQAYDLTVRSGRAHEVRFGTGEFGQDPLRGLTQRDRGWCRAQCATEVCLEEPPSQPSLRFGESMAGSGLRHAQALRSSGDGTCLKDRNERLEMVEIQNGSHDVIL